MATVPLSSLKQIWSQLTFVNKVLCRRYSPGPTSNTITVPALPKSLQSTALHSCLDDLSGDHMGYEKTLHKLEQEAYWVYMSRDVEQYCRQSTKCNASKPPTPHRAPMTSVPIGKRQMVAADILEVPVSSYNNHYLLIVQDYFTKWVEVVPMPDQTATRIVSAITKIFCFLGILEVLHSDQGCNF